MTQASTNADLRQSAAERDAVARDLDEPLTPDAFIAWLRREGESRYHAHHPFHRRMHEGALSPGQLRAWVANRYYYQTRIPIKDALILAKSEDPAFRRLWIHRLQDHDGTLADPGGGLSQWEALGRGVGLDVEELRTHRHVLPGVRFACDAYVHLVREGSLVEAVASSLTEFFAPALMTERIAAWQVHYPWIASESLDYFRARVSRAAADSAEAVRFVATEARTYAVQAKCVGALVAKTQILWHMLDCLAAASVPS